MLTLEEARTIQTKREKAVMIRFILCSVLIIASTVAIYFAFDYFQKYVLLYLVPAALLALSVPLTKLHFFFKPKEYSGIVKYCKLYLTRKKPYLSHQAGVSYTTYETLTMELIIEDQNGEKRMKTFSCNSRLSSLKVGDLVTVLRFIDQPILNQAGTESPIGT